MDQDLRELVEQMRDLVKTLQGLDKPPGSTSGASSTLDRGIDRMIVALGQLAVKLDGTKKTRAAEEEAIKKFAKAVEKTTDSIEEEEKKRRAATKQLEEEAKEREEAVRKSKLSRQELEREAQEQRVKDQKEKAARSNKEAREQVDSQRKIAGSSQELFDSLSTTGGSAEVLKSKFMTLGGESALAHSGLKMLTAGVEGAAAGLKTFSTGLLNGERGAQLTAKALTDFTAPLINAAEVIGGVLTVLSFIPGPIGLMSRGARIAGAALFGVGAAASSAAVKLNELGAKQVDTLLKSFNDASQAGVALTGGLEGTLDLMHTLNMTTAEAAQFNDMLAKSNKQLAQLGGTAGAGARRFAEVSGALVKSNIGETFEIMGITQQEQREAALLYMSIQARTGQMQLKNTEQLIQESGKFVEELDRAAQLTGATRKEQQEAREAAMAETRFRAAMIDARQRGDKEDQARLEVAQRTAAILKSMGDEKGFVGVLQQAAGRGALTTPEAIAAEQSYRISEILAKPNVTDEEILAILAKNSDINLRTLASTNRLVGQNDVLQTSIVGMDNTILRQTAVAEEAAKAGFTGPNAITNYLRDQEERRKRPGGDVGLMVSAGRAQQAAAMTMEAGINTFNVAADINKAASQTFANAVNEFSKVVGAKGVAGGTPTYGGAGTSALPAGMNVAATNKRVEAAKTELKSLEDKIKVQEEKLRLAKTDAEKQQAKTEIERLKGELTTANKRANAAELEQIAARNRAKLGQAAAVKPVDTKLLDALSSSGITDKRAQANILAQVQAESGGVAKSESLKYTPEQLLKTFPGRVKNIQDAEALVAGGEEAIGERVYGGRMGNLQPGEGFKYRGRGLIQLTGKENYKKFGDIIGIDLVSNPELANDPEVARRVAAAYFAEKQKSGVDLTKSKDVSRAVGHVDIGGAESSRRAALADTIAGMLPQAAKGGILNGPMSGYPAMLHGKEAVIPLENGSVPVSMPALDELVSINRTVDTQIQVLRNEVGSMMRELTSAMMSLKDSGQQERMVQLLESISRSQQTTASASQKMAQLAAN